MIWLVVFFTIIQIEITTNNQCPSVCAGGTTCISKCKKKKFISDVSTTRQKKNVLRRRTIKTILRPWQQEVLSNKFQNCFSSKDWAQLWPTYALKKHEKKGSYIMVKDEY